MTTKSAISASVEQPNLQPTPIPDGFVRPPHGRGLLRAPWAPGERGVPHTTRNRYAACQNMCRERSAEAADKMYSLMSCGDERIELMETAWIYERAWGKPKEVDLSVLNGAIRPAEPSDDTIDRHAPVGQP